MSKAIQRYGECWHGHIPRANDNGDYVLYDAYLAAVANLEAENAALREQLDALQWRPITEQDLPKVGDEVGKYHNGLFLISRISRGWKIEWEIQDGDWTHFRPLNAPPAKP